MPGFANETGTTIGVEESTVTTTSVYRAHLYKLGSGGGWTSTQLPFNLTSGEIEIEVEVAESSSGHVMIGVAKSDVNLTTSYPGAVANSWAYYCHNGHKHWAGTSAGFGPSARTGDKIVLRWTFVDPIVRVFKNGGLMGYIAGILNLVTCQRNFDARDIPFKDNDLRIFIALHSPGEHVKVQVSIRQ